jgi:hypothetical protein
MLLPIRKWIVFPVGTRSEKRTIRGPFAKFVGSPYYSESERCGGAVTVFFRSTSLGKRCASYNAPPTSRKRNADLSSLRNVLPRSSFLMVGKAEKSHAARSEFNSVFRLEKLDRWKHPTYSPDVAPCDFWDFPTMKREPRGKKFRSDQRSAARFREVGGALQEMHRLPREVLRKRGRHRTSTKFLLGIIRRVHELCKRPS